MQHPKPFLQQVDDVIEQHLTAVNLLEVLSMQLHLSPSQIYRKIKRKTGYSPSIYIRKKRLTLAHQWLLTSDAPIQKIAFSVGFQTLSYFSRCFYQEFGYRPSAVRQR